MQASALSRLPLAVRDNKSALTDGIVMRSPCLCLASTTARLHPMPASLSRTLRDD
ncbi:hypothetical protein GGR33_001945 [Methylobacterium brachythecii]|uniref:Uncharacterized protein n=1 Tax=Methylobacterium brachythecii TaxID=1176177 RepID=A0A7W6F6L1_9HYPH|nr:hypothetical protein [Methylobacterium brachythecii]